MFDPWKCDMCGDCLVLCPYVDYDRDEAMEQFRNLKEGGTPPIVSHCVTCVACNHFCEKGAKPFDLILSRQEETGALEIPEENTRLDELFELIGVERVKREHDRKFALCCGAPVMPRDRARAKEIKERNIRDAASHGAQAMAYLCPLCFLNLWKAASAEGLENYHIIELVKKALHND